MNYLKSQLDVWLLDLGIDPEWVIYFRLVLLFLALIFVSFIIFHTTKKYVIKFIYTLFLKSKNKWDDLIVERKALNNFAHLAPAIFVKLFLPYIFSDYPAAIPFFEKITDIYMIIVGISIGIGILNIIEYTLSKKEHFRDKPITSYVQLIKLILYIISGILILSTILDKSPLYFLSAFGAMTAILLLVFKDTILGLVASIQISANDMVRVGDWIEMPKFNADGDVLELNLNTVKVQNFDKTITTIPTYYFITDSFRNWRGMQDSGGRRIKRSFYIISNSLKFVDSEMREAFKKYQLIKDFIEIRQKEIDEYNIAHKIDQNILINGRRMTNIGLFRKYIELYLKNHPSISQNMTILVRQLSIDSKGIPIEIYCFTKTTDWSEYEEIQSDIFDHLLSAATFFELDIYQEMSSKDFSTAFHRETSGKQPLTYYN